MPDVFVDIEALTAAGEGITELLAELERQPVSDIDVDRSAVGHGDLATKLESFCERWQIGVQNLAEDGRAIAEVLLVAAETYRTVDETSAADLQR